MCLECREQRGQAPGSARGTGRATRPRSAGGAKDCSILGAAGSHGGDLTCESAHVRVARGAEERGPGERTHRRGPGSSGRITRERRDEGSEDRGGDGAAGEMGLRGTKEAKVTGRECRGGREASGAIPGPRGARRPRALEDTPGSRAGQLLRVTVVCSV